MAGGSQRFRFVQCPVCDLVYLSPRVTAPDLPRYYGSDYLPHRGEAAWGKYASFAARGQRSTDRTRVQWARRAVRLDRAARVLDLGCGRPTFLEALVRATGVRGVGVDVSDAGWVDDSARWRGAGLELHRGGLSRAALADLSLGGPFDLVTLWHALEHDGAPLETLSRLRDLTRPGGALLVEVPNHDSLTRRLHGTDWAGYHTPRHTAVYTPRTLRALLERGGWRVERQERRGTLDPYVLWWLGRQERAGRDLKGSLERAFLPFMAGKVLTLPVVALQRWVSLGVQLAVARR